MTVPDWLKVTREVECRKRLENKNISGLWMAENSKIGKAMPEKTNSDRGLGLTLLFITLLKTLNSSHLFHGV